MSYYLDKELQGKNIAKYCTFIAKSWFKQFKQEKEVEKMWLLKWFRFPHGFV